MRTPFKIGDIVQLNSGGSPMTVVGIDTDTHGTVKIYCSWLSTGGKEERGHYPPEALNIFKKPKSKGGRSQPYSVRR